MAGLSRDNVGSGGGRRWLVVTSSFPRHDRDLAGHFVRGWAEAIVEQGDRVDVLCWRGPEAENRRVEPGLTVRFVPYGPPQLETLFFGAGAPENLDEAPMRAAMALPAVAAMVRAVFRARRRRDYDGIVGHWLVPGGLVARLVGSVTDLDSRVVGHSGGVHLIGRLPGPVGRPLTRWITAGPTTVPTEPLRSRLTEIGGASGVDSIAIAPMGYEPGPETADSSNSGKAGLKLGFLGRLVPIKGLPTVFEAIRRLRAGGMEVELEVVGPGPCRDEWEARAGGGVEFSGPKYGADKWESLTGWDALVMPSRRCEDGRHEGLPVSLLEAASVETIPLVSGIPGVEPWLADPGRQIVGRDVGDWVEAIRRLDTEDTDGLAARSREAVADLAWPNYGRWWSRWLAGRTQ